MRDYGCDGVVASGSAIKACRDAFPQILIASPGIRPSWAQRNEHKRFTTPEQAVKWGSDILIVGRPIYQSQNPEAIVERILKDMREADES